jgi:metal-responsive CopG/Arc/MetJ family transcriptional regulator
MKKFERINITLPKELVARMKKVREEEGIPISVQIRKAMEKYLEKF